MNQCDETWLSWARSAPIVIAGQWQSYSNPAIGMRVRYLAGDRRKATLEVFLGDRSLLG
jgi:hypothetical protein